MKIIEFAKEWWRTTSKEIVSSTETARDLINRTLKSKKSKPTEHTTDQYKE